MVRCETCGAEFKNTQGLAGHRRIKHTAPGVDLGLARALTGVRLHRDLGRRLTEKIADRLAEAILREHQDEILEVCLEELSRGGMELGARTVNRKPKAIIVAAGRSERLFPLAGDKPVCLLVIGSNTILDRQLEALRGCGIEDIVVVRGYRGDKIRRNDIRYYDNLNYETNNMLTSLFCAEREMASGFVLSYSDILYDKSIVQKLLEDPHDISLVVDTEWMNRYQHRHQHPVAEAELVEAEAGLVLHIGRNFSNPSMAHGEFIGLARFTPRGAEILRETYARALRDYRGRPFHQAVSLDRASLIDVLQHIIDQGHVVNCVDIQGGCAEIDTPEDLGLVQQQARWN
ncbi:MAG: phosphocholine cytidylyltransferase family protein [Chloroflexi bacterium]|nr:phosphocholine cytidylyltransferase family protein [Chloroflexota bacterium]